VGIVFMKSYVTRKRSFCALSRQREGVMLCG